jgi:Flp pilus assembly protein TadD
VFCGNCFVQGKLNEACEVYKEVVAKEPKNASAHKLLSSALLRLGLMQQAEAALVCAVECNPSFAEAWSDLGSVRRWQGDPQGAVRALRKACELSLTRDPTAHWHLAMALRDSGAFQECRSALASLLELRPTLWNAHVHSAICAVLLGKESGGGIKQALAHLHVATQVQHSCNIYTCTS